MGKGKECGHPIPSASMAQRQPGKQQKKRVLLCVSDVIHLADEYDPHPRVCHRAFELFAAGNAD